ncbi:DUF4254 domain-containing protein [Nocardia seriolae]|uniref:Uncharacterized protein n=1 Tax=Nocardia seriolae TaxID=37332 RepID=A0A0B8NFK6_9NOCA|nr:DUF4254 domain-containing protein [Nocardia seriolae]MTJ65560.1 DUF4254 domain-containing protein [Nocardia seriolae]MTJ75486.1 DUF4254 domain-containing protein [Nocardia seriolae]MTJ90438.1 DUF4254 domain-containing protein [Nocardia seriolae]MTK34398.1 DUF4254 domain-containing protein [Nocardia seriolae]MTK43551.1 DUF4254 domain-containing protein [Nocardia seriolae]
MAIDYTGAGFGAELPSPSTLLRAFREPVSSDRNDHDVLESAHELVRCHENRHRALEAAHADEATPDDVADCTHHVDEIDMRREELVARIDDWVAANIPHRAGASLHTETLGAVIDRMAAKWVVAQLALGNTEPEPVRPPKAPDGPSKAPDGRGRRRAVAHRISEDRPRRGVDTEAHLQWYRLAELADGYRDLITEVAQHRRRLPTW